MTRTHPNQLSDTLISQCSFYPTLACSINKICIYNNRWQSIAINTIYKNYLIVIENRSTIEQLVQGTQEIAFERVPFEEFPGEHARRTPVGTGFTSPLNPIL